MPAQVPDAGYLRGGQGEDLADRPAALHCLRLLCRGLPHEVPRDGHPVFGGDDCPPRVVHCPGGRAEEEGTGPGGCGKEGIKVSLF